MGDFSSHHVGIRLVTGPHGHSDAHLVQFIGMRNLGEGTMERIDPDEVNPYLPNVNAFFLKPASSGKTRRIWPFQGHQASRH